MEIMQVTLKQKHMYLWVQWTNCLKMRFYFAQWHGCGGCSCTSHANRLMVLMSSLWTKKRWKGEMKKIQEKNWENESAFANFVFCTLWRGGGSHSIVASNNVFGKECWCLTLHWHLHRHPCSMFFIVFFFSFHFNLDCWDGTKLGKIIKKMVR